jgi:Tol biopolymer transport system component
MKCRFYVLLSVLALILGSTQVSPVFAKAPKTAKIAFHSTRDRNLEIYIMNPDGSQQINLTWHASRDFYPAWSPTGEHIAFNSNRDGVYDIYLMDADGKSVRKMFRSLARREYPAWSPDGQRLAYLRRDDWGIYVSTVNGEHEERVASPGFLGGCPAWSPDGSEIVFVSIAKQGGHLLKAVNLQTREERILVPSAPRILWGPPAWSPDGTRIVFYWSRKGIYVVNSDGKGFKRLILNAVYPAWSPLGDELIYVRNGQLFIRNFSRRRSRQLTRVAFNSYADWFDPQFLHVQPQASLLTTTWAAIR